MSGKKLEIRIRALRQERGWTLQELANLVGTTAQTVQRLETNNMTISTDWLERFGEAFGVEPIQLLATHVKDRVPVIGRLAGDGRVRFFEEGQEELSGSFVRIVALDPVAVRIVEGFSDYRTDSFLICERFRERNIENCVGADALACLGGNEVVFGRIIRGELGKFTIVPPVSSMDVWYDRKLEWTGKPIASLKLY